MNGGFSLVYSRFDEMIGNTPLLRLSGIMSRYKTKANIYGKLEYMNPAGSSKDRAALFMIKDAFDRGVIDHDTLIIEPTSGNTGIGLALVAAVKGYKLILVMPESMSLERRSRSLCAAGLPGRISGVGHRPARAWRTEKQP